MHTKFILIILLFYFFTCIGLTPSFATAEISTAQYADVSNYISSHWSSLIRDITKCETFGDQKIRGKMSLYFPANVTIPSVVKLMQTKCQIHITSLPPDIIKIARTRQNLNYGEGLLYLPHPYVVPGGMFNEMYGWDSYFIIRGLVEENQIELAKGMVENFFFEIDHYGNILNANRLYYLSRSQPPFLTSMILSVYNAMKAKGQVDLNWLQKAYAYAIKDYEFWIQPPHLAGKTGLSRYRDFNDGPVIELREATNKYYRDAVKYFLLHKEEAPQQLAHKGQPSLIGSIFTLQICQPHVPLAKKNCNLIDNIGLTKKFYRGDRAIRESGLDITFRFGPFGANTIDYAPMDLNCLLYKIETDLELISEWLGKRQDTNVWHQRALVRKEKINRYFWNQAKGLFFDFNFKRNQQSTYEYVTTFYPLWVGLATPEQALAVKNNLKLFEQKGGLAASTHKSGAQWDYPYGWAPFQLIAIEGLRHYGFHEDADRLTINFLNTIAENFRRDGTIREKYNVVTESSETEIKVGYVSNEIGFGWTNGVFVSLLNQL